MVDYLGKKEQCKKGLSFKNRNGEEYIFDNEENMKWQPKQELQHHSHIAAEAPDTLTKQEEMWG